MKKLKILDWIGSSKKDLMSLPEEVRHDMGYGLYEAQEGKIPKNGKVLKGFGGAGVLEIIVLDSAGTYRTIYTINFPGIIYVLHVFQKKSKQGIKTPKKDMDLVHNRLKLAKELYKKGFKK